MMYKQFWCKLFCVDHNIVDINTVDAITLDHNIVGLNDELVLDLNAVEPNGRSRVNLVIIALSSSLPNPDRDVDD